MDKLEKYISKDISIPFKDEKGEEEIFTFKPMKMKEQIIAIELLNIANKIKKDKNADKGVVSTKFIETAFDLFTSIVKRSFEGITDDTAENFVSTNFNEFLENLDKLMPRTKETIAKDKLEKIGDKNDK